MPDETQGSARPIELAEHDAGLGAHFDAGERGCGDGLARELRRHLEAVAVGERLQVTVRDPSAKADLPSVARLLGHRVLSEEPADDGRLVITVERGK